MLHTFTVGIIRAAPSKRRLLLTSLEVQVVLPLANLSHRLPRQRLLRCSHRRLLCSVQHVHRTLKHWDRVHPDSRDCHQLLSSCLRLKRCRERVIERRPLHKRHSSSPSTVTLHSRQPLCHARVALHHLNFDLLLLCCLSQALCQRPTRPRQRCPLGGEQIRKRPGRSLRR